jgi:membrane associated rhomboid family serine protease
MADDAGSGEVPVCYRHPGREAHIRCNRCERYICPDDMISAAVGFQCPECVHAGNKNVREARTVTGATLRQNPGTVTLAIIVVNVLIFFAVQGSDDLLDDLVLRPYSVDGDGVAQGGWHRLITAAFLHQEPLHIAMNMLLLYLVGRPLEAVLGRGRFLATYLICALGGSTASYLFMSPGSGSLGASGAVFGMVGALVVIDPHARANPSSTLINVGILLLPGFIFENIDWRGHVGGLITGALLGALFLYAPARNRSYWQAAGCLLLTALLLVAVALRSNRLDEQVREGAPAAPGLVVPSGDNACGELHPCNSIVRR